MICKECAAAADWDRAAMDYADAQVPRRDPIPRPLELKHCNGPGCMCRHRPVRSRDEGTE